MALRNLFSLFLLVVSASLPATTYYLDATAGNNANDGLTPATAWKDLFKIRTVSQQGGDEFLFKRGERWDGGLLYVTASGEDGNPVTYGAYGTGALPIINVVGDLPGTEQTTNWTPAANGAWSLSLQRPPERLFLNGTEVLRSNTLASLNVADNVGAIGVWYYHPAAQLLYVVNIANPATAFSSVAGSLQPSAVQVDAANHLVFTDLDLRGGYLGAVQLIGGANVRITNCTIGREARNGVALSGNNVRTCDRITVENNLIVSGYNFFYGLGSNRGVGDGVLMQRAVTNSTVANNTIQNWTHNAVELIGDCASCAGVNGNKIFGNTLSAADVPYGHPLGADGLIDKCRDNEVYNNVATDCRTSTQLNGNNNWYHHNTFARQRNSPSKNQGTSQGVVLGIYGPGLVCENNRYEHNVFHDLDEAGILIRNFAFPGTIAGNIIRNNILSATGKAPYNDAYPVGTGIHIFSGSGVGINTIQHNLYFDPRGSGNAAYENSTATAYTSVTLNASDGSAGFISGNLTGSPAFADPDNANFQLTTNSAAIDAGLLIADLTTDLAGNPTPQGAGADIGAYEFQCTDPDPVCCLDSDGDGTVDCNDNCVDVSNGDQSDRDADGVGDLCDNCPDDFNRGQRDDDGDGVGNACDRCPGLDDTLDSDGDGITDCVDNCDGISSSDQSDRDADGVGDLCDNCPDDFNRGQRDDDGDGVGNACDRCPGLDDTLDSDGDGITDCVDNCDGINSGDQSDRDGDGVGDLCDNCPNDFNRGQRDDDGDGVGNACDRCPGLDDTLDSDGDGITDCVDNCDGISSGDQSDRDGDGVGDLCDNCPDKFNSGQRDDDGDGVGNACDRCPGLDDTVDSDGDGITDCVDNCDGISSGDQSDRDGDGVGDLCDNCPDKFNSGQRDDDGDGVGNACDRCPGLDDTVDSDGDGITDCTDNCDGVSSGDQSDRDGDGVGDLCDNCPDDFNRGQRDDDGDGVGNACDLCPGLDDTLDSDGDGITDCVDNCDGVSSGDQSDSDGDGVGDLCDNCPDDFNRGQRDDDGDGVGNACDRCPGLDDTLDSDGDGITDCVDNCDGVSSGDQSDGDGDGVGDLCDNCPDDFNSGQRDDDGDGVGNACDQSSRSALVPKDQGAIIRRATADFPLYPNPARDEINVGLEDLIGQPVRLTVYNQLGQVVRTIQIGEVQQPTQRVDVDQFGYGTFLLELRTKESVRVKKFVILR